MQQNKLKRGIGFFTCSATVDGRTVATAEIMCTAREIGN
ncbi:MAG: hypothetical protein JAY97_19515 [Candidatus Thiodiazotropha sp. 'RUGA']|nr:hypothetical protein [Candidatus Thiodiazotropha sp. 'RUGA']